MCAVISMVIVNCESRITGICKTNKEFCNSKIKAVSCLCYRQTCVVDARPSTFGGSRGD